MADGTADPRVIHLKDYTPFPWVVDEVYLNFALTPRGTRVTSRIRFRPNPDAQPGPFFLHGEDMRLIEARIDGQPVQPDVTPDGLLAVEWVDGLSFEELCKLSGAPLRPPA